MENIAVMWFERDLRIADNPALSNACSQADIVVPLFIDGPPHDGWPAGSGRRWWLGRALVALDERLREQASRLLLRCGEPGEELPRLIDEVGAKKVFWNRRFRPGLESRDAQIADELRGHGIEVQICETRLLHDPDKIETNAGGPYHVFTPFWRKFQKHVTVPSPLDEAPLAKVRGPQRWPQGQPVEQLIDVSLWEGSRLSEHWTPGELAARQRLEQFAQEGLSDYPVLRDRPDISGTSQLSPHLASGTISPTQVWHGVDGSSEVGRAFRRQLAWREFSYHLLHHYPETVEEPLREKFRGFRWIDDPTALTRWQRGQTGFPIVDAGMHQLRKTGWMHNRVRMIVASFLTKDLLIPWQRGARWFWEHLVDADLANNTMGWQWSAGCGADAQPFFRVFNPVSQAEKFDPHGTYIRRFVPELTSLSTDHIHAPWRSPAATLREAEITLGEDYPEPMVDHGEARKRALERYEEIK